MLLVLAFKNSYLVFLWFALWLNLFLPPFLFFLLLFSPGWMFTEVLQHLCAGDSVRGLVFVWVPPAIHPGREQVCFPENPTQHHRHPGYPAFLYLSHCGYGLYKKQQQAWRRSREQVPGTSGPGAALPAGSAHPLRDAISAALAGAADPGAHRAPVHEGVWAPPALPVRCHGPLLATGISGWERTGSQARIHKCPHQLLVGCHLHDHCWLRGHGAS